MHQGPHDISDHVVQKSIGRDVDADFGEWISLICFDADFHHVANRRRTGRSPCCLKAGEVMLARQQESCFVHGINIQMVRHEPPVVQPQRIQNSPTLNLVTISLFRAMMNRVEAFNRRLNFQYRDVFPGICVEGPKQVGVGDDGLGSQRAHLTSGVDSAIGPAAGSDA